MPDFYVICDNIRSLYNVGAIFRTADAFGVKKIYLCGITGTPAQRGLLKVSLGAENAVAWEWAKNTWQVVEKLKKQGVQIIALEQTKKSVDLKNFKIKFREKVITQEQRGISETAKLQNILRVKPRMIPFFGI